MSDVTFRPLDIERDAGAVADMWNMSDLQWPASWTRGVPLTADVIREQHREQRFLMVYVAELDGQIIGYCSFMDGFMGREGEGYLALLNVSPPYHGIGVGRRLIQSTIDHSVGLGWQRQTLQTWPANLKAVPLYKKTGHFWTPDTAVLMQNFIPGALQLPLARPFFERHDWYSCYLPSVAQEADDQLWEGMRVFSQHWRAGDEFLTIRIDRETRAPIAVETNDLSVAAIVGVTEPLAGSVVPFHWRLTNRKAQPLPVFLQASGEPGLTVTYRDAFVVSPGETVERLAAVQVEEDAPWSKEDGTAPAVRSLLRLDGDELELFTGLRARRPLHLDTTPARPALLPGHPNTVTLQIHSQLDEATAITLSPTPPPGLSTDWSSRELTIAPRGHIAVPVELVATAEGVHILPVSIRWSDGECSRSHQAELLLPCLGAGGLLSYQQGDSAYLESDEVRVTAHALDGIVTVEHKDTGFAMATIDALVGPPFYPSDFQKVRFDQSIQEYHGRACIRMVGRARNHDALYLHQSLVLSASGLLALHYTLENRGQGDEHLQLRLRVRSSDRARERIILPLRTGLVQAPSGAFPLASTEAPRDAEAYAEPWLGWVRSGVGAGIAWGGSTSLIANQYQLLLDCAKATIAPGSWGQEASFAFYAGWGDWQRVRGALVRWAGRGMSRLQPGSVVDIGMEPRVLGTISGEAEGGLIISSASSRAATGEATISLSGGAAYPDRVEVKELARGRCHEERIRFALPQARLGVFHGRVAVKLPRHEEATTFAVVRLGNDAPVLTCEQEQAGHRVWCIANGMTTFRIAPDFGPSVVAWEIDGQNQLHSAFPQRQGFSWIYPWFGGICPQILPVGMMNWAGCAYREQFDVRPIEVPDACGLPWQGIRLATRPMREDLHDLLFEVDYLTLGGSSVLKTVCRLRNLRQTAQVVMLTSYAMFGLGGRPADLVLYGESLTHRPNTVFSLVHEQRWGALSYPGTGRALIMVGCQNDISLQEWGQYGRSIGSSQEIRLSGDETRENIHYLVLTDSLAQARDYIALQDYAR